MRVKQQAKFKRQVAFRSTVDPSPVSAHARKSSRVGSTDRPEEASIKESMCSESGVNGAAVGTL